MALLALLSFLSFQLAKCQQQPPENVPSPTFFISLTSVCRFNNIEMNPDTDFVAKGSLCAYAEEAGIMYSCPAGDPYCWNQGGTCSGGSETTAGPNEVACSDIGSGNVHWCCNSQFGNCTQTPFQQNNCWSWFDNPNRDINSLAASASASSVMQSAVSQPTVTNIVVEALAGGGWVPTAISTTSSTSSSSSILASTMEISDSSHSSTPGTAAATAASKPVNSTAPQSLAVGAIAGIAIGAAVAACLATIVFFLWHRRHRSIETRSSPAAHFSHARDRVQSPLGYKGSVRSETSELSSIQSAGIVYGQPLYTNELDGSAIPKPAFEKGHRDSRWSGR